MSHQPLSLGVSFALSPDQTAELLTLEDDEAREAWLEALEEEGTAVDTLDLDKAWDALHRCLGDGSLVINEGGPGIPHAVFGTTALMKDDDATLFAGFLPADQVPVVATALADVDREWLRGRYDRMDASAYGQPLSAEDFDYTADSLPELQAFLERAAQGASAVVFTVAD